MGVKFVHILFIAIFILVIGIGSYELVKPNIGNINIFNTNQTIKPTSNNTNSSVAPSPTIGDNSTLNIPPNDYVINHINWSSYPSLQRGYIQYAKISSPEGNITHNYIDVAIYMDINNDNQSEVVKEMKGVLREARMIYGPNSLILIITTKNGVFYNNVNVLPYSDEIIGGSIY